MLLNNQVITAEVKKYIEINCLKYIEINYNENMMTPNIMDTAKAILKGKCTAIQSNLNKQEKNQINNLILHLKQLENGKQIKFKVSRRK